MENIRKSGSGFKKIKIYLKSLSFNESFFRIFTKRFIRNTIITCTMEVYKGFKSCHHREGRNYWAGCYIGSCLIKQTGRFRSVLLLF